MGSIRILAEGEVGEVGEWDERLLLLPLCSALLSCLTSLNETECSEPLPMLKKLSKILLFPLGSLLPPPLGAMVWVGMGVGCWLLGKFNTKYELLCRSCVGAVSEAMSNNEQTHRPGRAAGLETHVCSAGPLKCDSLT